MTKFEAVGVLEKASHPPSEKNAARAPRGTLRPDVGRRAYANRARAAKRAGVGPEGCGDIDRRGKSSLTVIEDAGISIGVIPQRKECIAVPYEGRHTLAMLKRQKDKSLAQLLSRLDLALRMMSRQAASSATSKASPHWRDKPFAVPRPVIRIHLDSSGSQTARSHRSARPMFRES
jgi:hypothetical protein